MSLDLALELKRRGLTVQFWLLCATGEFVAEARRHFDVLDLGVNRARWALPRLVSEFSARQPQAVIAMMWPLTFIVPLAVKLAMLKRRVVVCEHGMMSSQYATWGRIHNFILRLTTAVGYRLASAPVAVSSGVAKDMSALASLPPGRVTVIHNPVPGRANPNAEALARANALWHHRGPRILSVGSFKRVKNYPLLVKAFAKLSIPDAQLMLLGQGDGLADLQALAADLGVADRVIFGGFHTDPAPFYATADLFVLSSDSEGLPTVLIEALSFGLPIVSTDCPSGPSEILADGRWGRLVPVGDEGALAMAISEVLQSSVDRDALKRRAQDFAPAIAAQRYLDLLGLS